MANLTAEDLWKYLNNCHLDVDAKLYGDLLCVICQRIMQKPFQGPCGCKYCHKCIGDYLDGGEKMCPGKLADCKTRLLRMGSNLHEDNIANKKISLIPLQCAAEYCQYRNSKTSMMRHIASHQLGPHRQPHTSGDTDQSPMWATTSPLDCAIDCRVAMLAETIHNWRTEVGFMKDWADENRLEINELLLENEHLKDEICLLREEGHKKQAEIDELVMENRNLKNEDHTKERIFNENKNFENEVATNEKLRQRIVTLEKENKQNKEEINQLKNTKIQENKNNANKIANNGYKSAGKKRDNNWTNDCFQLTDKDMRVEMKNLENIVKENEIFAEKVKSLQLNLKQKQMAVEEMTMGNEDFKKEIAKYEKLCDRLKSINMENKDKQDKINALKNDIFQESKWAEKLLGPNLATNVASAANKGFGKGKHSKKREKRRKQKQANILESPYFVDYNETLSPADHDQIAVEINQFYEYYGRKKHFKTEMKKNEELREMLKQLRMETSKLKKLMKHFITPDTANTRDWGTLCEEEQPLTDKSAIANVNVQIMVEKNKTLLEKIKDIQADNEKKQETINKLKCILIVQQYKAKENLGKDNGKDLDDDEDRGIAANYPLNHSDWIEQGHRIINCTPFEWKISSFSKKLEEVKSEIDKEIFSEPFYSHKFGYKMQLRLRPMGTHLSVFVDLLRGEYDDALSWPMTRDVAVAFLNQRSKTFQVVYKYRFPFVENEESDGLSHPRDVVNLESVGSPHFIKSFDLLNNSLCKKDKIVLVCFLYD